MTEFVSNIELDNRLPGVIKISWTNPDKIIKRNEEDLDILGISIVRSRNRFPSHVITPHHSGDSAAYDGDMYVELQAEYPEHENHKQTIEDKELKSEIYYYFTLYTRYKNPANSLIYYYASGDTQVSCYAITNYNNSKKLYNLLPGIYKKYDAASKNIVDNKGPLERFLELFGQQYDYLQSATSVSYKNNNIDSTEGIFIKLFANWIGWKPNYQLDYSTQRNEIKNAPELYKTIGNKGNLAAYARYLTGSECRVKEFLHNVFLSNNPERYYLRQCAPENGQWIPENKPLSVDFAYEGKVSVIKYQNENLWMFYHANRTNRCNIWYKTFEKNEWKSCTRLSNSDRIDRNPTAVKYSDQLWVFWDSYNETKNNWQIRYKIYNGSEWSEEIIFFAIPGNESIQYKSPSVCVADLDLWVFWQQKNEDSWQWKYAIYHDNNWGESQDFLLPQHPLKDLFIFFSNTQIWAFWTERVKFAGDAVIRYLWTIKYAHKEASAFSEINSDDVIIFPKNPADSNYDDVEPFCTIQNDDHIKMYWSSNKNGSWSLFSSVLSDVDQNTWEQAVPVSRGPYNQRNPFIIPYKNNNIPGYRSNECIPYYSDKFKYADKDFSTVGSTITESDNILKQSFKKTNSFDDFVSYTYDTGTDDNDLFARDTLGVYLTPIQEIHSVINYNLETIRDILREFLPVQLRALIFYEVPIVKEVYNDNFPAENFFDKISNSFTDQHYTPTGYAREDTIPNWIWMYTADCINGRFYDNLTVNFNSLPLSTTYRTWHTGLKEKILWK